MCEPRDVRRCWGIDGPVVSILVLALLLLLAAYGCSSPQHDGRVSLGELCVDEIDRLVAWSGVVVTPTFSAGDSFLPEMEVALIDEGLAPLDYETAFELNGSLILYSVDGWAAREGSRDAVVELLLLKDVESEQTEWVVAFWRVRAPCTDPQRSP